MPALPAIEIEITINHPENEPYTRVINRLSTHAPPKAGFSEIGALHGSPEPPLAATLLTAGLSNTTESAP